MSAPLKINEREYNGPLAWLGALIIGTITFLLTVSIIAAIFALVVFILLSPIIAIVLLCILLF